MVDLTRFPCGEFLPGQEPRSLPSTQSTQNNLPAVYHPSRVEVQDPFVQIQDPGIRTPGRGRDPGYGLVTIRPRGDGDGGPGDGGSGGPGDGNGGEGGGPRGGGNGGPTTGGSGGSGKMCVTGAIYCTNPGATNRVRKKTRTPVDCPLSQARNDTPRAEMMFINRDGGYDSRADGLCLTFPQSFFRGCVDGPDLPNVCITGPITGSRGVGTAGVDLNPQGGGGTTTTSVSRPTTASIDGNQQRLGNQAGSISNSRLASQSIVSDIPVKQITQLDLSDPELQRFASASSTSTSRLGLYDRTYNFFNAVPNQETEMVYNYSYPKLFKPFVAREVKYFLNREIGDSMPWHEQAIKDLTLDKLILSITPQFLTVINNLHNVNNTRLSPSLILEVIRSHLVAGSLSEFDPDYFTSIYNSQIQDNIISIPQEGETGAALQISMGLFERDSLTPDFRNYTNKIQRDNYKRFRVLLEDIRASIPAEFIDGVSSTLYLNNAGIPTEFSSVVSSYTNIGDGAGYYINTRLVSGTEVPLVTENVLSSAYYLPAEKRANLLELLGTNIDIVLTASSTSAHEFSNDYNPSGDLQPMYFKINFETIGDILNANSVVNIMSATFTRISDSEAINHSRNYSFNTIRVNVDFRDPFIQYARDTSTILLEQDDFNLRSFGRDTTILMGKIILRNLPAAIVLVPGAGSYHNPFNAKSRIVNFQNTIIRTLNVSPSFDVKNQSLVGPPLSPSNTYNTLGTPYFGLYERDFDQDLHGNLYTYNPTSEQYSKSYYISGQYSSQQPEASLREGSIESRLINGIVKKLTDVSGVEELTWWDIYRRLTAKEIGKLSYININEINNLLANGFVDNVKVFNVLSTIPLYPTGIPGDATVPNDTIIINEGDRVYVP